MGLWVVGACFYQAFYALAGVRRLPKVGFGCVSRKKQDTFCLEVHLGKA
jgi:hypothetical protein